METPQGEWSGGADALNGPRGLVTWVTGPARRLVPAERGSGRKARAPHTGRYREGFQRATRTTYTTTMIARTAFVTGPR